MPTLEDRVTAAREKLKTLEDRQKRADARHKALAVKQTRKQDTRRKILVGAIVLARAQRDEVSRSQLLTWLNESLTRPDDRALFDLAQTTSPRPAKDGPSQR